MGLVRDCGNYIEIEAEEMDQRTGESVTIRSHYTTGEADRLWHALGKVLGHETRSSEEGLKSNQATW